jgi:hypothetical protein
LTSPGFAISKTESDDVKPYSLSLPGLTRQSIVLDDFFSKKMDLRVKPRGDEATIAGTGSKP